MTALLQFVSIALFAASLLLLVPVIVLATQVFFARRPPEDRTFLSTARRPSAAVLMPAHDEAVGIAAAIKSILSQLTAVDRLVVVADNCTDGTAALARSLGAEVIERIDPARRGKGYALDFGVRHFEDGASPEVIVIVDADCELHAGSLDRLARECERSRRPVQALYLMHAPAAGGLKARIAEFAWTVRNQVRPLGFHRMGLPCQLMGTGMAFPWESIRTAKLASAHLVEDMQLGLDMALAGTPPLFCDRALVTSSFPETEQAIVAQRTRWEHGHLSMIAARALPMLGRAIIERRASLAAMAFDLCVPPLASMALMLIVTSLASALLLIGGVKTPIAVAAIALTLFTLSIGVAWHRFARHIVSFSELLSVPRYVIAKIPIYARLVTKRQVEWVRTKRNDTAD